MTNAVQKIMAARVLAQSRWPYISHLIFSLRIVQVDDGSLETMAVDAGWRLYFNPDFVLGQDVSGLATVLQHEALHCMLKHSERYQMLKDPNPDHTIFNVAADCGINHVIESAGFSFSSKLTPVRYKNYPAINSKMSTEQAYYILKPKSGESTGSAKGPKKPNKDDSDTPPNPGAESQKPDCGSVAGGSARPYELPADDAQAPAASAETKAVVVSQVASDLIHAGSQPGAVPGDLVRWAEDLQNPRVDWRRQLAVRVRAGLATKAGRRDYSMMRPSRREQGLAGNDIRVRLPAMRKPNDPTTAVVVDTSGSISDELLKLMLGEVIGITKAVGNSQGVFVIACDHEAHPEIRVRTSNDVRSLKLQGGGGTDMGVGILAAIALKPKPDVIVVITDGYTPWPESKPKGCDNYVVLLTMKDELDRTPSWAKVVVAENLDD